MTLIDILDEADLYRIGYCMGRLTCTGCKYVSNNCKNRVTADFLLKSGVVLQLWCSEPPKKSGWYIVAVENEKKARMLYFRAESNEWTDQMLSAKTFNVKKWMPLPELPKENSDD